MVLGKHHDLRQLGIKTWPSKTTLVAPLDQRQNCSLVTDVQSFSRKYIQEKRDNGSTYIYAMLIYAIFFRSWISMAPYRHRPQLGRCPIYPGNRRGWANRLTGNYWPWHQELCNNCVTTPLTWNFSKESTTNVYLWILVIGEATRIRVRMWGWITTWWPMACVVHLVDVKSKEPVGNVQWRHVKTRYDNKYNKYKTSVYICHHLTIPQSYKETYF